MSVYAGSGSPGMDELLEEHEAMRSALLTVVAECSNHTYGKPMYDITLDHLHDIAEAALNGRPT